MFTIISPGWQSLGSRSCRRRCHQPGPAGLPACGDPVRSRELPGGLWIALCWWSRSSLGQTANKSRQKCKWPIHHQECDITARDDTVGAMLMDRHTAGHWKTMSYEHYTVYTIWHNAAQHVGGAGGSVVVVVSILLFETKLESSGQTWTSEAKPFLHCCFSWLQPRTKVAHKYK